TAIVIHAAAADFFLLICDGYVFNAWKQPLCINPMEKLLIIYARPSTLGSISFHVRENVLIMDCKKLQER
ncbi:hypothetical protein MTR67_049949, partial [Solanum verrucosum]